MSNILCKAIGYAMPWHKFESITSLDCEAHETARTLENTFSQLSDKDLTVDDEAYKLSWNTPHLASVFEKRLLSRTYTEGNRYDADIGNAEDLFTFVYDDIEDISDVMFFPSVLHAKIWYRRGDELDWQFVRWDEARTRRDEPDTRIFNKYVHYGFGPWTNSLMNENGDPQAWQSFLDLMDRPDLVPQVPHQIRWYLKKFGILEDAGVNLLRPLVAQWWR